MALIECPECDHKMSSSAAACPACGYPNPKPVQADDPYSQLTQQPVQQWSPGIAAVLSLVIPGAGQMYKGKVGAGLIWLLCVAVGYAMLIVPGIILHIICIVSAASGGGTRS